VFDSHQSRRKVSVVLFPNAAACENRLGELLKAKSFFFAILLVVFILLASNIANAELIVSVGMPR